MCPVAGTFPIAARARECLMMTASRVLVVLALLAICWQRANADEIRRFVEMSYVCDRDAEGRILFAHDTRKQSYEVTAWSDPFTENICLRRNDMPQGCNPRELYDFSFRCGQAGTVHVGDFYLYAADGRKLGAHRDGDRIALNGGQQRVLISHPVSNCYGRGLSLSDMSACLASADQYRLDQISIKLPPNRAPLPAEVVLTTKVIGDDCGNEFLCNAGLKCSKGGGCVPRENVDCGNGRSCVAGNKCSFGGGCVPLDSVDCGSGRSCPQGTTCGTNSACIRPAHVDQEQVQTPQSPTGWHIEPNSLLAVTAGVFFAGLLSWISATLSKIVSGGESPVWRKVAIGVAIDSMSLCISGVVLYHFGIVDEVKLLSIPIGAGISVAVISSVKMS
jgi:hypothetical protein